MSNSNRIPLNHAAHKPVISKKPDITRKIHRVMVQVKPSTPPAAAPVFVPKDKPTGAVAIHPPPPPPPPRVVAKAPRAMDQDFFCERCGQRRTSRGCLCALLTDASSKP